MKIDNNDFESSNTLDDKQTMENASHPTLNDEAGIMSQEDMKEIRAAVQLIGGYTEGFASAFLNNDGYLVDVSDKAGRARDRRFVLGVQSNIKDAIAEMNKRTEKLCRAHFAEEDKAQLEKLNGHFRYAFRWLFGACLVASLFFITGIVMMVKAHSYKNDVEQWYATSYNAINFGEFIREHDPSLYELWYSGDWEKMVKDKAKEDSIRKRHDYKNWKSNSLNPRYYE